MLQFSLYIFLLSSFKLLAGHFSGWIIGLGKQFLPTNGICFIFGLFFVYRSCFNSYL